MKQTTLLMTLAGAILILQPAAFAQSTNFDVTGATEIYPTSINSVGAVAGWYFTTSPGGGYGKDAYGFVRDIDGTIHTFSTPAWAPNSSSTMVWGMNSSGLVVGDGYVPFSYSHYTKGYERDRVGTIAVIDVPGSGVVNAQSINTSGVVTGYWGDPGSPYHSHGYVRDANWVITTFDAPNLSKTISTIYTNPTSVNDSGDIAGTYTDSNNAVHIFLRNARGHFTSYDIRGSVSITVARINNNGVIAGSYWNGSALRGYTQATNGHKVLSTFAEVGTVTFVNDINFYGTVVGAYSDGTNNHGFLYSGTFLPFDATGAVSTVPQSINDSGVSTGYFKDSSGLFHGFIR